MLFVFVYIMKLTQKILECFFFRRWPILEDHFHFSSVYLQRWLINSHLWNKAEILVRHFYSKCFMKYCSMFYQKVQIFWKISRHFGRKNIHSNSHSMCLFGIKIACCQGELFKRWKSYAWKLTNDTNTHITN